MTHTQGVGPTGRALPCRPYRYDSVRCYRTHQANDPLLGKPIEAKAKRKGRAEKRYSAVPTAGPGTQDGCQHSPHAARCLGRLRGLGMGEAERCQGRASASRRPQGPQGLDSRSTSDLPAMRSVRPYLRALGTRSHVWDAALLAGGSPSRLARPGRSGLALTRRTRPRSSSSEEGSTTSRAPGYE